MPHPLIDRVEQVQAAARRLRWRYALALSATAAMLAALGLGLFDYLLRPHDVLARWLLSAVAVVAAGVAFVRFAWPVITRRERLVATARRIERHFPSLGERLSSAVAFLGQSAGDPSAGSLDLRRAVVAEADALSVDLNFRDCLDRRAPRGAILIACAAAALIALLAIINPPAAGLAAARLAMPWRSLPWPRRHELVFAEAPARLAIGDSFEAVIVDRRGKPPERVEMLIRSSDAGGTRVERKEMKPLGQRMVLRLDQVTHGFEYRARGGDDDVMPWRELAVVEPPRVTSLEVRVVPPAYTGLAEQAAGRLVKALIGSQLRIRGRLDKPIHTARLKTDKAELPLPPVQVAADGRSFSVGLARAWLVEQSASVWIEMADRQGLTFGHDTQLEVQAIADAPPSIAWESPGEHTFVTARAIVPLTGVVKDDLAVRGIQLRFLRPEQSDEEQVVEIFAGPAAPQTAGSGPPAGGMLPAGDSRTFSFTWDLTQLAGLSPGDALAIRITAEDYQPQLATTTVRRLTIITDEELAARIATRQAAILGQIAEALRLAEQAHEQTGELATRLREASQPAAGDARQAEAILYSQRQIARLLGTGADGAEGQITAVLDELATNRAADQPAGERLRELQAELQRINGSLLPAVEQDFIDAQKSLGAKTAATATERLESAAFQQGNLIERLEKMVGSLSQWDSLSRVARDLGQIRDAQQRLLEETTELQLQAVASADDAPAAQRTLARQLGQRELELARRLDKLQSRMEEMLTRQMAEDPLSAAALAEALGVARRAAIGSQMREAASRLSRFQPGQATEAETAVLASLKELQDALLLRREDELARRTQLLREASSELGRLRASSQAAAGEIESLDTKAADENRRRELERLARQLQELARESQSLARRLERLQAPRAAQAVDQAAARSTAAAQAAAGGNTADAQPAAADSGQRLKQAEQELARAIAEAEERLAEEQSARIEQLLAGLAARQKNALVETARLEKTRDERGQLPAIQEESLRHVAAEQRLLADELEPLRIRLKAAPAFEFALGAATDQMRQAAALLLRGQTSAATQHAEQAALAHLEQILAALKSDEPKPAASPPPGDAQPQPGTNSAQSEASLAELKLLKSLQEAINARTAELEAQRSKAGRLTPEENEELALLARQQGRLADIVLGLIAPATP
jgi:hypothetical protein